MKQSSPCCYLNEDTNHLFDQLFVLSASQRHDRFSISSGIATETQDRNFWIFVGLQSEQIMPNLSTCTQGSCKVGGGLSLPFMRKVIVWYFVILTLTRYDYSLFCIFSILLKLIQQFVCLPWLLLQTSSVICHFHDSIHDPLC